MKKKHLSLIITTILLFGIIGLSSGALAEVITNSSSESIVTTFEDGSEEKKNNELDIDEDDKFETNDNEISQNQLSVVENSHEVDEEEKNILDETFDFEFPSNRSDLEEQLFAKSRANNNLSIENPNLPRSNFIDISSHNGNVTVTEFKKIRQYGVTGVSVKLTEHNTYKNPYAAQQIKNAQAAGLIVSVYHYSWFTSETQAKTEAEYFAKYANELGLSQNTLMVNDIEDASIKDQKVNHTKNSQAFRKRLNQLGYNNVNHYIGLHWITEKKIDPDALGKKNVWVAAYPFTPTANQLYSEYGAWQWTSKMTFPGVNGVFDMSSDYTGSYSTLTELPPQGNYISDGRHVKISKKGYNVWSNFDWKYRDSTDNLYGQTFLAKGRYQHIDGNTYFSLYDKQGKWYGYLSSEATTILDGAQGAYISDGSYISIIDKNFDIWSNFNFNKSVMSTSKVYQKTYLAKGRYEHFDGNTYYSLYDGNGKWVGYLDARATKKISSKNGEYINYGKYVTVKSKNYKTWSNFEWKYRESGAANYQKTYLAKGKYENLNGATYLSIFDSKGNWKGYINAAGTNEAQGPQGMFISSNKYAFMNVRNKNLLSNFKGNNKQSTNAFYQKTLKIKGYYKHFDGTTYYSLYNQNNQWQGYAKGDSMTVVNDPQGKYISYGKKVKITKKNYTMWGNFSWTKKKGNSTNYLNQKILAKGLYHHANGATYYSLYDAKGNWLGYINADATK